MNSPAFLEVRNLAKHFPVKRGLFGREEGVVRAVDDVSFSLEEGQTLALVGESGCGKTTLVKLLLLLLSPSSGQVLLKGKDINQMTGPEIKAFRTDVQAVFQDPWASLSPRMRVFDIVAETLVINENLTKGELTKRVDEALEVVGLRSDHAKNYPHEFSGGQRQRIAIASAIIARPKLMVLDEPVSALDVSIRSQIMNLFKDLQMEYGCSYIVVAHDLGTTRFMADKLAVMYLGKLVEFGATDDVFENTLHPYTQALLSAALPIKSGAIHDPIILSGEVPSPVNPPSGCSFHPRCRDVIGEICQNKVPKDVGHRDGSHRASCHLCL